MSNEFKSKPTKGFKYKVKSGDLISIIAARAYGDYKLWPKLQRQTKGS
jgi:nucleoid-associated protein YgaU